MRNFETNKKVWSIGENGIIEHTVEDVRIINKEMQIKINNKWHASTDFHSSLSKAMDVEEGHLFMSFN